MSLDAGTRAAILAAGHDPDRIGAAIDRLLHPATFTHLNRPATVGDGILSLSDELASAAEQAYAAAHGLKVWSVGLKGETIRIVNVRREAGSQHVTVSVHGRSYEVDLPLAGDFQVSNALIAAGLVLATGGGAVLKEANRQLLRERTQVIYLRVQPEEIFRRLKKPTDLLSKFSTNEVATKVPKLSQHGSSSFCPLKP